MLWFGPAYWPVSSCSFAVVGPGVLRRQDRWQLFTLEWWFIDQWVDIGEKKTTFNGFWKRLFVLKSRCFLPLRLDSQILGWNLSVGRGLSPVRKMIHLQPPDLFLEWIKSLFPQGNWRMLKNGSFKVKTAQAVTPWATSWQVFLYRALQAPLLGGKKSFFTFTIVCSNWFWNNSIGGPTAKENWIKVTSLVF